MTFATGNRLLSVHADSVWAVKWSPTAIITAGIDSAVKFWQASSLLDLGSDASPTPTSVFDGHSLAIVSVAMNPSSTIAASSAMDGFVITYDITEPKQLKKIDVGPSKNWCVSLSDQLLATGGYEGKAQIYNYHSGDNLSSSIAIDNPFVLAVQFNASGSRLALGGSKGEAALFDPVTGQVVEKLQGYTKGIRCIEFAASDNNVVLIGGESNSIILFDVRSGYHIASLACHSHWVMGLASHPTRAGVERFASCSSDKTVKVWDLRSRNVLHLFDKCHSDQVTGVAFSPDGNMLVSVSDDASMQFYNSPQ